MKPKISVIIPCYNRDIMLMECIESFINQKFQNFELIIIDDGSTDDLTYVTNLDERIKYLRQERAGYGADRARNMALKYALGEYILVFDSDDLATPKLLIEEVRFLEEHPEYDAVYADAIIKNTVTGGKERRIFEDCNNTKEDYKRMLKMQFIPHVGTMWRYNKMPLHDETLSAGADWDLYLKAMENGVRFYHLNKVLWIQRIGHEQESYSQRQTEGCKQLLVRRGYRFDPEIRTGVKI